MITEEIKQQAKAQGIIPGVTIQCAFTGRDKSVVPPYELWKLIGHQISFGEYNEILMIIRTGGKRWATVVVETGPFKEGDATACDSHMRKAIVDLAKVLNIPVRGTSPLSNVVSGIRVDRCSETNRLVIVTNGDSKVAYNLRPEEFIRGMCTYNMTPKCSTINGHKVTCHNGVVDIDDLTYSNDTIKKIAALVM